LADRHPTWSEPIAIIGMAGRFPGANSVEEFWRNLCNGVESITQFTNEDLDTSVLFLDDVKDPAYVKAGGPLDGIEDFDASFFGLSAREAEVTDPQHRLFLECAWQALEGSGHDPAQFDGLVGVYASAGAAGYLLNNVLMSPGIRKTQDGYQLTIASSSGYIATRVSFLLNLRGPSFTVGCACSSSMVGIHLACRSLLDRECDMALAGGASIRVPQKEGHLYRPGAIVSSDGHTRTFDAGAEGTMFTSGVGVVLLRRLADALADGDNIRAVIRGIALNNDGARKVGYTAPSVAGQASVIEAALDTAGIDPETISYTEAHGTATPTGDPIEVAALTKAFRRRTQSKGFCAIGTGKTNIGHLDIASGVAGVMKTALSLEHKQLPPSLNFERPNPAIDFSGSPFYVNTELSDWETSDLPRRAGVAAFGVGGTNGYAILEEAPSVTRSGPSRKRQLLTLSAKTPTALGTARERLASCLGQDRDISLPDVCYTLMVGRGDFPHRWTAICKSTEDAIAALRGEAPQQVLAGQADPKPKPIIFMFPGQGSEHLNMASGLYVEEPDFRDVIDECAAGLERHLGVDLRDVVYPPVDDEQAQEELSRPSRAQPALFMVSYALAKLWMKWGVTPEAVVGHSTGEVAAACVAGVLSLEDALRLICVRGRLSESVPPGRMLAAALSEEELVPHLVPGLSLAVVGGPTHCVVSGRSELVDELAKKLKGLRVPCRRLPMVRAFHSEMLDPVLPEFREEVAKTDMELPKIPMVSTRTGTWAGKEIIKPEHWVGQVRNTVRFHEAIDAVIERTDGLLLEVGPGQALTDLVKRSRPKRECPTLVATCRHEKRPQSDGDLLLSSLARLWLAGVAVDWRGVYARERRRRLQLPTYPFERKRYWIEPSLNLDSSLLDSMFSGRKADVTDWFYVPSWKRRPLGPDTALQKPPEETSFLVFVDNRGLGAELATELEHLGCTATTVVPGSQFERLGERSYAVDPRCPDDYLALAREIAARGNTFSVIIHLWSVERPATSGSEAERFEEAQDRGYYSILSVAQALAKLNVTEPVGLLVLSEGAQAVTGDEALCPEKVPVLGLCRVIPQEYPDITCRNIDVEVADTGTAQRQRLVRQLLAELLSSTTHSSLAYRGNHRWIQSYEPIRVPKQPLEKSLLRPQGVYLITGGLGGIGLVLAAHLSRAVRARLVLVGRTGLPPREEWAACLTSRDPQDPIRQRVQKVMELEELGGEVLVVAADVSDEEQMREAISKAKERFGAVNGVFHAAGVLEDWSYSDIPSTGRSESETHFVPKVRGTLVLAKVLKDTQADFCMLTSSISIILGGLGNAAYASANAFMDAFAQKHANEGGTRWISVDWDMWKLRALETLGRQSLVETAITSEEGAEVFGRLLCLRNISQIVVSTSSLGAKIHASGVASNSTRASGSEVHDLHPRPDLPNPYVPPQNETQEAIAAIWRDLFGAQEIGIHDNFFELGGHSLLATQVVARLRKSLEVSLPIGALFESSTVAELAEQIVKPGSAAAERDEQERLLDAVEELSEDEAERILANDDAPQERAS